MNRHPFSSVSTHLRFPAGASSCAMRCALILATSFVAATGNRLSADDYLVRLERLTPTAWSLKPDSVPPIQVFEFSVRTGVPFRCRVNLGAESISCRGVAETSAEGSVSLTLHPQIANVSGNATWDKPSEEWSCTVETTLNPGESVLIKPSAARDWTLRAGTQLTAQGAARERLRIRVRELSASNNAAIRLASAQEGVNEPERVRMRVRQTQTESDVQAPKKPVDLVLMEIDCDARVGERAVVRAGMGTREIFLDTVLTTPADYPMNARIVAGIREHDRTFRPTQIGEELGSALRGLSTSTSVNCQLGKELMLGGTNSSGEAKKVSQRLTLRLDPQAPER